MITNILLLMTYQHSPLLGMSRSVLNDLLKIFKASYKAVLPDKIIKKCITYNPKSKILCVKDDKFNLSHKNVYVAGAGKAVQYMAREIDTILGSKIKQGIISIPAKSLASDTKVISPNLSYSEGAQDNLPDAAAETTAKKIKELASSLKQDDFLMILISGGGSSLLPLPAEPITLNEKIDLIKKLANSGADINELNIVRKKLSAVKGGKLAIAASPATTVTLILSDVVNDPFDIIASGPTVEDKDDAELAIGIIKKHNLYATLPHSIRKVLENRTSTARFPDRVRNYLIGTNEMSVFAAYEEAKNNGYMPIVLSRAVTGNVKDIAKEYVHLSQIFSDYLRRKININQLEQQVSKLNISDIKTDFIKNITTIPDIKETKFCLILGGETTVEVKGNGKGGRNQQLALEFSNYIHKAKADFENCNVYMLSAGTDGIDGPTNAAGAMSHLNLISDCEKANIDVQKYLRNNDSYNFFKSFQNGEMHVVTGHTNTNVMDTHLIIIQGC